ISDAVRQQFHRRFRRRPGLLEKASLLSLNPREYTTSHATPDGGEYILVVGNHYEHKDLGPTIAALSSGLPDQQFVVVGLETTAFPNVRGIRSGGLPEERVAELYQHAKVVIYPSHYEGFGFPVLTGLGYHRPVFLRRLPVFEELAARLEDSGNLYFY